MTGMVPRPKLLPCDSLLLNYDGEELNKCESNRVSEFSETISATAITEKYPQCVVRHF